MGTEALPLMIDADVRARLERVAAEAGHSAADLAGAVLREFLDENDAYDAAIQEGIDDVEAGRVVEYDVVKAEIEAQLAELMTKR
jgi:predicted transcriptional regulator